MSSVNVLKSTAIGILMDESFTHIRNFQHHAYKELAEENASLRSEIGDYFQYAGIVYPLKTKNGLDVANLNLAVRAVPLHFSLVEKLEKINQMQADAGERQVRNFFIAVINYSANGIVLRAFLPDVLINRLRKDLGPNGFNLVDVGPTDHWQSVENTAENIKNIKEHYVDMIPKIRELLMDKLLLQD